MSHKRKIYANLDKWFICPSCQAKLDYLEVEDGDGYCFKCVPLKKLSKEETEWLDVMYRGKIVKINGKGRIKRGK